MSRSFPMGEELIDFFEKNIWPNHYDLLTHPEAYRGGFEAAIDELKRWLGDRPSLLQFWTEFPLSGEVIEIQTPKQRTEEMTRRIRLFGPQRTRVLLSRLLWKVPDKKAISGFMDAPFSHWEELGKLLGEEEMSFEWRLESALLFEFFLQWCAQSQKVNNAQAAKKWLFSRWEEWKKRVQFFKAQSRSNPGFIFDQSYKCMILFDIGRATLIALSPHVVNLWKETKKAKSDLPVVLWSENQKFSLCSAQLAALWAQAHRSWSPMSTPLRLLMRPWRMQHTQVKRSHVQTVDGLIKTFTEEAS